MSKKSAVAANAACAQMNSSLLQEYNNIKSELVKLTKSDLFGRRKLGEKFSEVLSDKAKYGDKSCLLLAEALGVRPNFVYTHARVATTWDDSEIAQIAKDTPCVSFSHLIHISAVPDAKQRAKLIAEVQSFDLAVDATAVKARELVKPKDTPAEQKRTPLSAIKKTTKLCTALLDWQEEFESLVFDPLTDDPAEYTSEELIAKLSELSAKFTDIEEMVKGNKVKTNACIAACQKAEDAASDEIDADDGADFDVDDDSMPIPVSDDDGDELDVVLAGLSSKNGKK